MVSGSILMEYNVEQCGYETSDHEYCYNEYMDAEIKFVILVNIIRI